ncbi:uncharacterized protein [Antedon mediterranea]
MAKESQIANFSELDPGIERHMAKESQIATFSELDPGIERESRQTTDIDGMCATSSIQWLGTLIGTNSQENLDKTTC